jgi:hypothetical protein
MVAVYHIPLFDPKTTTTQEISPSAEVLWKDIDSPESCEFGGIAEYWPAVYQEETNDGDPPQD